jgi:Lrp/AsnC family leucine-responsive transcriptional regulator
MTAAHLDEIDRKILRTLQSSARTSNSEIARQLGMVPSAILERIRKLEEKGYIEAYEARLNPKLLGRGLVAFVSVKLEERGSAEAAAVLARVPEILEIHCVAGEDCYLLKVRVADVDALRRLLAEKINAIASVVGTRTTVVLGTEKETTRLPVEVASAAPAGVVGGAKMIR